MYIISKPDSSADQIVKPMIVLPGANEPRVLQVESDELVEAVRNNAVPVDYVLFDDGQGFRNRDNEIEGYRVIQEFLDQRLGYLEYYLTIQQHEREQSIAAVCDCIRRPLP